MSFGFGFDLFSIMFTLIFGLVIGTFLVVIVKSVSQWNKNNHSPRLSVQARVVAKRNHRTRHDSGSSSTYYVTFEVASGDRMELHVAGHEYGLLVEGDIGMLEFQGTRYLGFQRKGTWE